ncbi:GspH/FimT family pseudopilin [Halopseudomonas sp.]|uniref:GspH/FimT family pseudopilin n=1 Tax=Halopseudomonas sp. TaxID=2901191 RepID=UPI00311D9466
MSVLTSPHPNPAANRSRGFTLIELMVTITVAAVLLTIALPSFVNTTLNSKLRATANNLSAAAMLARSEAIKRNSATRLCASDNGTSCSGAWEDGWIVISSDNTVVHAEGSVPDGYKVNTASTTLTFEPSGVGSTAASFVICRATPSVGSQERLVSISATGRPSVTRTTTGTCS